MGNCKYPCAYCKRVKDPEKCDNKNCAVWQKWFLRKWEALRRLWTT